MDRIKAYKQRTFALLGAGPGDRVLDVGCGCGADVLALAAHVGAEGKVVGLDADAAAVAQARGTSAGTGLPVDFRVGDAHALPFADAEFHACRADCTFQHLDAPRGALAEMVRVARPGGRVVVSEPDWETLVVDAANRDVTRAILRLWCDRIVRNGWIGRELPGMFRAAGLRDVEVVPVTIVVDDLATASAVFPVATVAETAAAQGVIARDAAGAWVAGLERASRGGCFFGAVTGFVVVGRKA